ncbi:Neuroligin-4, X-linked [Clonorchis sinensis]|uniref:Neuroligin-4, X-linked n=1 Tax=Clonorchis sinensis TaxID=79923 RepID=A0A419PRX0_CLOSI|nr:Neuroligin-4, X-linked [Clonorchis sinensis]
MLICTRFIRCIFHVLFYFGIVHAQYDHCLLPTGCQRDDCCFNTVAKTGPVCDPIPGCAASFRPDCCRNARPVYTDYGIMYGYAILLDDPYGYHDHGSRYLEIWRSIPYARPPTRANSLRFRRPVPPVRSQEKYDATYFRASCAQPVASPGAQFSTWATSPHEWDKRINFRQPEKLLANTSEDCLYLNIYTLNETDSTGGGLLPGQARKLPILVFFDGMDHLTGTANRYPGHILAQLGVVVITVNYRLGPFGYLATESKYMRQAQTAEMDNAAFGNYGLWDQVRALEFIKENARKFFGDPNQITVVGHGSAAADLSVHLLSRYSGLRKPPLFNRAILLSGSDQMEGGFTRHSEESAIYAKELARQVGCDLSKADNMMACLRSRSAVEIATAAAETRIHRPNWLTRPWSPTVDGDFIQNEPSALWKLGKFAAIPVIGGLMVDDAAVHALASLFRLQDTTVNNELQPIFKQRPHMIPIPSADFAGFSEDAISGGFNQMIRHDFARDPIAMTKTLLFEYTDWSNSSDSYKRWSMYRQAWTDRLLGSGLIQTLRYLSNGTPSIFPRQNLTQMYVFAYRSPGDPWARLLGAYGSSQLQYIFGIPRLTRLQRPDEFQQEWRENLNLEPPDFQYTSLDRNMTDYMLYFISNFVKSGNATPIPVRNLTWDTYRPDNRTYLWLNLTSGYNQSRSHQPQLEQLGLGAGFDLRQNYKAYHYAYWKRLYPIQLTWLPRFTPPMPTPPYVVDYGTATISLSGILVLLCILTLAVLLLYCRKRRLLKK